MAKFCGKCGTKLNKINGFCPNCDADKLRECSSVSQTIEEKEKNTRYYIIRKLFFRLMVAIVIVGIILVGFIVILSRFKAIDISLMPSYEDGKMLEMINEKNIIVEKSNTEMIDDKKGTAKIVIKMPNYELLFKEASKGKNPDIYLLKALILKKYKVEVFEKVVDVTHEKDKLIIHSDEAVHELLEENLIKAINALEVE